MCSIKNKQRKWSVRQDLDYLITEVCNEVEIDNLSKTKEVSSPQALIVHCETATAHANDSSSSKVDQRKFTSQKYELKYTWLYFSHANNGYMCKICEFFAVSSSTTRAFISKGVILGTHPWRQLETLLSIILTINSSFSTFNSLFWKKINKITA